MLIQPYDPIWALKFKTLRGELEAVLCSEGIEIVHVGSTSIVGLSAKPIIDVDIIYEGEDNFNLIKAKLEKAGYYHNGNQGIEGREVFKRSPFVHKHLIFDSIRHHLYVCDLHSVELRKHLFFREYLTKNPNKTKEYEVIKFQLAREAKQDQKKYATLKETKARSFFDSIYSHMN